MNSIKYKAKAGLVLAFLLCVVSWHGHVAYAAEAADTGYKPGYQILDIHFIDRLPHVEIEIEGHKVKVVLCTASTGAGLMLYKDVFSKLKTVKYTGQDMRTMVFGGSVQFNKKYTLPSFSIGPMHFNNLTVVSKPNPNPKLVHGGGASGTDLFKGKKLIIDYGRKKFIIMEPEAVPPPGYDIDAWIKVPFIKDNPRITKKDKGDGVFINASLGDDDRTSLLCLATEGPSSIVNSGSIGTHKVEQKCYKDGCDNYIDIMPLKVGGQSLGRILAYVSDVHIPFSDGELGYNFFRNRIVYLDFPNQIMRVKLLAGEEAL